MIWIVNLVGIVLIASIVWWFWLSSAKRVISSEHVVEVLVDNGVYDPAHIQVTQGQPLKLRFLRNDPSPCAEQVVFEDFKLSAHLPVGETVELAIPTEKSGRYEFTCQMRMYRGILEIK